MVNTAEMGGRKPGEKPSSFSVTCSLLSQYLKEKGSFGELSLGMTATPPARLPMDGRGKPETLRTMNLLPGVETPEGDDDSAANQNGVSDRKKSPALSMGLFHQRAGLASIQSDKKPDVNSEHRAAASQMTIFYGGKVVVFDNFPAEKARELMVMAGRGSPDPTQLFRVEKQGATPVVLPQRSSCPPSAAHAYAAAATILASTSESKPVAPPAAAAPPAPAVTTQEAQENQSQPASSDLPIARRVSLHRFLEKRKDRITSKAPYQLNAPPAPSPSSSASPPKPEGSRQWLGLGPQNSNPGDLQR